MSRVAKNPAPATWRRALMAPSALLRPRTTLGRAMIAIGAGLAIAFGLPALWQSVRSHVAAQPEYLVNVTEITISPPPDWIRADVKAETLRDAALDRQISILDDRAVERISQAFALHPWVARVQKIERTYPAAVHVELVYRRPVAMVEVSGGLLPIDADGTLLPPADFTSADAAKYIWVSGIHAAPRGGAGTRWGDPAIHGAAALAAVLSDRQELGLQRIRPQLAPTARSAEPVQFEVLTRRRTVFIWGSAPGEELPGEAKAVEKLARLKQLAAGGIDQTSAADQNLTRTTSLPLPAHPIR